MAEESKPPWDEELAAALVGAKVLVGLTFLRSDSTLDRQIQLHGEVVVAKQDEGVCIALHGVRAGAHYWLPPDLRGIEKAKPGTYRLRSTGEEIVDPDYITTWTITAPAS